MVPFHVPVQLAGLVQLVPVQLVTLQKVPFHEPVQLAGLVQLVPVQLVVFVVLQKVPFQLPEQLDGLLVQLVPVQLVVHILVPLVAFTHVVVQLHVMLVDCVRRICSSPTLPSSRILGLFSLVELVGIETFEMGTFGSKQTPVVGQ